MSDRTGQLWGNYRLVRLIGRGGFAEVYLGQHVRLTSQQAALKILSTHLSEGDIDRFQSEAEMIVSLVHPHIVRVLDFSLNDGIPFLVMDYAPGGSLRHLHRRGERVDLPRVVSYIQQIADGLQYAHDRKIIHRDIKPDNMLIGVRGEILLSDFGIATIAHGTSSQSAQVAIGTIPYMAPEQIQEHPRQASDQYALAITAYEWLAGKAPFTGTFTEVAAKHMMVPPPSLSDLVPGLPQDVERVIATALAKEPKVRFRSVQAFARALTEASRSDLSGATVALPAEELSRSQFFPTIPAGLAGEPMVAPSPERQALTPQFPQSNPPSSPGPVTEPGRGWDIPRPVTPPPVAPVTPLPIPSGEGWETQRMIEPPPAAQVERREMPAPAPVTPLPAVASMAAFAPPPVGAPVQGGGQGQQRQVSRRAVVAGLVGLGAVAVVGGSVLVWNASHSPSVVSSATPTPHPRPTPKPSPTPAFGQLAQVYSGHRGPVRSLAWSPDGKSIASGSEDKTVQVWDPTTGQTLLTYSKHTAVVLAAEWSLDGKHLASGARDKTAQVWDASTGAQLVVYHGHTDDVHAVAWSPDGSRVASGSDDTTVQVWNASTGALLFKHTGHTKPVESVQWSPDGKSFASACDDQTVQIVDIGTQKILLTYHGHSNWVLDAVWSPDGKSIASTGRDQTVQLWNASTGTRLWLYRGDTNWVEKLAWSPDGKYIVSVSDDKTARILDASSGKLVYTYHGPGLLYSVTWSPDGKHIATGASDKSVQIWSAG